MRRRGSILCAITQHGWKEISSMKRTTKKTLFVFVLIAAMMLSIFPAAAFAEGAAAVEPAAQTEQQPEKDAAPAANDDGVKPAEPAKDDGAKPAEPVKDGENKAEPVKNDEKSVVVEGKDGEKPADPELKDGGEKGEPEVKNDGEEPVKEEENTGAAPKTPEEENGDEKAEEEKDVPAVSDAVRAFLAAASAFTMPEDVMALTDEECQTLAAQINDLFVMYSKLSEEDLALPEVQAAAAALNAAYAALDARNTAEVLLSATRANSSVPLTLTVSSYSAPFINGSTGEHTVGSYKASKYIKRSDVGSDNSSGSATARFVGSNEAGWTLVIDVEVGNYKETWTTNAKITNKDMSAATGYVTFGLSFNTSGGTSMYIPISGGKDLPKPSPTPGPTPTPTPTPTPIPSSTPTPIPSSTPTPTPSTSPSPAPVVKATLNYDGNGAGVTNVPPSESKDVEPNTFAEFTVSSTVPERAGYTFKGWNTKADGSGLSYSAGATVKVFADTSETLYAQWDEDKQEATLVFGPNAGTDTVDNMPSDMTDTPKAGETSVAFPIPTTIPTREGYEFKHWNTKDDDSGDTYERGATINVPVGTTVTLYAIWEGKQPPIDLLETKLVYDANANDATNVDPSEYVQKVPRGGKAQFTVISDEPTRPGYTFTGWSIIPDAEVAYNPDSVVEVEAGAEMILYAVWVKNVKLEIIYDGNAPDAANVPAADVKWVAPGESYTFTIANGPTRPGYRFVEWNTADNGTGDSIKPGQTTLLHAGETGYSKTYYAKWEPEEVTPVDWGKLGISKSVSPTGPVKLGTTLTYTVTVTNNTGADLDSVLVYDKLDRHLTFVSATGAGSYSTLSGFWNVGALANGASAALVIKATVKAGTADKTVIYNTASVFAASSGNEDLKVGSGPSASANVAVTNPGSSGIWGGTTWGKGVQTGDDANLGLWIAAMIVSFLCVAALVYVNRKRIFKGKANNK